MAVFRLQHVVLQGEVEVTEIDVAAKLSGRVNTVEVWLRQSVKEGDLLFTSSSPEVNAKLTQAEAAQAVKRKIDAGARICEGLGSLGIEIDAVRNSENAAMISAKTGTVQVRVIHTHEDLVIARSVSRMLQWLQ